MIKIERTEADDIGVNAADALINVMVTAGLRIGQLNADVDALKLALEMQRADETDLAWAHGEIERLESLVTTRDAQASGYSKLIEEHVTTINELRNGIDGWWLILWLGSREYNTFHGTLEGVISYVQEEDRHMNYGRKGAVVFRAIKPAFETHAGKWSDEVSGKGDAQV